MNSLRSAYLLGTLFLILLAGCSPQQRTEDLEKKAAQATAEAKRDTKAIAKGIREGWSQDKQVDLNSAPKEQLLSLPGVTSPLADRIIAGRPYKEPADLLGRHIMRKAEYDKISDRFVVKP